MALTEEESKTVAAVEKALAVLKEHGIFLHSYSVLVGAVRRLEAAQGVYGEIAKERARQDAKWGEQNHRDGTGSLPFLEAAAEARKLCDAVFAAGGGTWRHILQEEVAEAFAEAGSAGLRAELLQVAAVAVAWIEAIDRREK